MATDIVMPQLGESIAEGTIVKWLVPLGAQVKKDDSLLEVETDKVALDIPSPATGALTEILIQEGETVPVGTLLARLDYHSESGNGDSATSTIPVSSGHGHSTISGSPDLLSPAVRDLAAKHQVDLSLITGTGMNGRITKKDILEFLDKQGLAGKESGESLKGQPASVTSSPEEEVIPLSSMRRTIAERMVKSRQTAAHVVTFFEADFTTVEHTRQELHLTYLPFVIKAVTQGIHAFPILNSSWSAKGLIIKHAVHIGIAVAVEEGLLVPVIKHADQKDLRQLGTEVADLSQRARSKQLQPEEVQGGTFTITNHGGTGSLFSTPIINQPQIAILGVGAVQRRAVVVNESIEIRSMAYLSLAFDHRVIDGATADQFMLMVKSVLEQPAWEVTS
ncbi:dihydrolipoamide acetyltransferase family protein [Candidatus Nitrospira neomarina]|uniref:Dihydrolipoamide acetyltransferase component of pyruvate dehydrogenase complex n=1 Tax=Candidatus Nitrospira neomarina TaxID=3020899 RepID=A0AA96GKQ5_9BACT|nr:dihydrolipoamide acetyltransferase family protein [Candidatus Nitrospira neomarina]WNM63053.1 dihydrolipoamide acetyltransferase family protein [Candidatus Nitrospira neomarina]